MSTWNEGYTTDVQYTSFFHAELAPSHLEFASLANGFHAPNLQGKFAYCELGCGQGVTLNALAAVHPQANFWGLDFNPSQIVNAQRMADAAGLENVQLRDWSFAQALEHADELPRFDVIVLHGILSWVSDTNRQELVSFIDRTLKPGGLVYASYNALPGWAVMAPLRHLARQHYLRNPKRSDLHVPDFVKFADVMNEVSALYFKSNPSVMGRFETMRKQPPAYLAHEFLNANWRGFYVNEIAEQFGEARLDYLASATLIENIPAASLPPGVAGLLQQHMPEDRIWQELAKDYANNKMFRRDLYCRGLNHLNAADQGRALAKTLFALTAPRSAVKIAFQGPVGEAGGAPDVYNPILDLLEKGAATFAQIVATVPGRDHAKALQAVILLVHSRQVLPITNSVPESAGALNRFLVDAYFEGSSYHIIVAPRARTALNAAGNDLILLGALLAGKKTPKEIASYGVERLASNGRALRHGDKALQGTAAVEHLVSQLGPELESRTAVWRDLGII
ncbi:class I SAM-dependent methyltransferase [Caulobacter segnis]|uniref:class I SAM-dependent methyltransferase n=1 Tax=Caulobacter segnis TaxID=88688 RepID=UPI00240FE05B|nr:class I SAM-dependent methyltransferase [Caulobacter segnis]MDG2521288.1 class I SAM-dependent methyltransferase [Caulobacter segnis]